MNKLILFIFAAIFSVHAFAQEAQPSKSSSSLSFFSSIFSPKVNELSKLVDAKKIFEANDYLSKEYNYFFVEKKKEQIDLLRKIGTELNAMYEPEMEKVIGAIAQSVATLPQDKWGDYRVAIIDADKLITDYKKLTIFSVDDFRTSKLSMLESLVATRKSEFDSNAPKAFIEFNHSAEGNFFSRYPVKLNDDFLDKNVAFLSAYVQSLNVEKVVQLKKKYADNIKNENPFD